MKALFKSHKFLTFLSLGISLLAVFVCSISTFAWFQINSQSPETSLVSGSSDINITSVTGHKIEQKLSADGTINRSYNTVSSKSPGDEEASATENTDLEGADTNFDVPSDGIGYYLVKANSSGNYRFSDDDGNYTKFTELTTGSITYISSLSFTANATFRIRSYQMVNHETQLTNVSIAGINTLNAASNATKDEYGVITVPTAGVYKVWFDKSNSKLGLERTGDLPQSRGPKMLYGTETLYLNTNQNLGDNKYWHTDSPKFAIVVSATNSGGKCYTLTSADNNYYSISLDFSNYSYIDFVRLNPSFSTANGTNISQDNFWKYKYNDTGYQSKPTQLFDSNNCFKITGWDNSGTWEQYSRSWAFQISANNGSTWTNLDTAKTENGVTEFYNSTRVNASTGGTVKIRLNEKDVPFTVKSGDGNNLNASKQIKSGGSLTFYVKKGESQSDRLVWVSEGYEVSGDGGTNYTPLYDDDGTQLKATGVTCVAGSSVLMKKNGSSFTYTRDSDTFNNIDSNNKAVVSGNFDFYFKNSTTLWGDGNKVYHFSDDSFSSHDYSMSYVDSGSWQGYYHATYTAPSGSNTTLSFKLNDTALTTSAKSGSENNFNGSTKKIKYGDGTTSLDIYINSIGSTKEVYVSPIYQITVTRSSPSSTQTKTASNTATNTWLATNFTLEDGDAVSATLNGSSIAGLAYETGIASNNINSSLHIIADATSASITLYSDTSKVWASGLKDPEYYVSNDSGSHWYKMTKIVSGDGDYLAGDDPQYRYSNLSLTAGQVLTFRKYLHGSVSTPAIADSASGRNNVELSNSQVTVKSTATSNIYLKKPEESSRSVWVTGYRMRVYFYNGDPSQSANATFYASGSTDGSTYTRIGAMTQDGSDSRLSYIDIDVSSYTYMAFHMGDTYSSSGYKTQGITINVSTHANKYFYIKSKASSPYEVEYASEAPSRTGTTTLYVNDPNNYFNGALNIYAWNNTSHARVPYCGALFPGVAMTEVVANKLYKISVNASHYDKMIFSGPSGTKKTADLSLLSTDNGKIWVATGVSSNTVSGGFGVVKTYTGTATITVTKSDSTVRWSTSMFNGDRTDSNFYIYERGIQAYDGDTIRVIVANDPVATSRTYNSKTTNFVNDSRNRPYLDNSLTVKVGGKSGRFNLYVTIDNLLSIVMVPDLGNGFYIMPYSHTSNSTTVWDSSQYAEGFIGAMKMQSVSNSSATYGSYFAEEGDQIFVGSYINAVEACPYTDIQYCSGCEQGKNASGTSVNGVIKFTTAGYYTIEVLGSTVTISPFNFDAHFSLNALDVSDVGSQAAISAQKTALVYEIQFTMATVNDFAVTPSLEVRDVGDLQGYVGFAFDVETASLGTPAEIYSTMKTKYDVAGGLTQSTAGTTNVAAKYLNNGVVTTGFNVPKDTATNVTYHAYILIDYYYGANFANMPNYPTAQMFFYIKTVPTA